MRPDGTAEIVEGTVARVRDDPDGRLRLMLALYEGGGIRSHHRRYRRATVAFMRWQLRRGLLAPVGGSSPGSAWWRAANESLLRDIAEARLLAAGTPGEPSSPSVRAVIDFIGRPSAASWYRAHNKSIARAYLANRDLAAREDRIERFFLNVVLSRVLYAHALVAAPALALGWLRPMARPLGDPRIGTIGIFLSLSRTVPNHYPLGEDVAPFVADENGFGRFLDLGIIQPRLRALYDWSAAELDEPDLAQLLVGDIPAYAWDPADASPWTQSQRPSTRLAQLAVPASVSRIGA
jgi:hypothetical protein